jgi:hypothetical protein
MDASFLKKNEPTCRPLAGGATGVKLTANRNQSEEKRSYDGFRKGLFIGGPLQGKR